MRLRRLRTWIFGLELVVALAAQAQADPFGRCEDLFAQAPERWDSARCFYQVASSERRWDDAAERLERLIQLHPDRPWLRLARAYVEEERSPRRATERYRQAVSAFEAAGFAEGEVRARCAFAQWLATQKESREAGEQLDLAVRKAEAAHTQDALAEALIFRARHLLSQEAGLHEPLRLAYRAESILFPRGDAVRQMLCLELLAGLERDLGFPGRAASRFRRLERLARENGRLRSVARAQLGLGHLLLDELDRAPRGSGRERILAQLRRALATAEEAGDLELQASARASLAHLLPEDRDNLDRCLSLARQRYDNLTSSCLLSLARLQAGTDEPAAERSLEEARSAAERSGDLYSLARFWYGRMNLVE